MLGIGSFINLQCHVRFMRLLPVQVEGEPRHGVDEDGGELVEAVEHEAVLPHHNGEHHHTHGQHVVGLHCFLYTGLTSP